MHEFKSNGRVTQDELMAAMYYDKTSGEFYTDSSMTERVKTNIGRYAKIYIKGVVHQAHRLAWLYVYGYLPDSDIDHIDRDRLNNRIENLRLLPNYSNMLNTVNAEGRGYFRHKNRWRVQPSYKGKKISLGSFSEERDAQLTYGAWMAMRREAELGEITPWDVEPPRKAYPTPTHTPRIISHKS